MIVDKLGKLFENRRKADRRQENKKVKEERRKKDRRQEEKK